MDQSLSFAEKKSGIPELRLLDRRAFIGFPPLTLEPGLTITDFALQIPDVKFPFNVTTGALRYQRRRLDFGLLDLLMDEEWIGRRVSSVAGKLADLEDLRVRLGSGHLEARARMPLGKHAPLTFKVSLDAEGERVAVCIYDVRFYGFAATAAAQVPLLITRWVQELNLLPEVQRRGASGFVAHILPPLARFAAVSRGYRMPSLDHARLSSIEISPNGLRMRFSAGGFPPPAPADETLLMALEGARAFSDAEELIAQGRLDAAREFYLMRGDADDAHPFAAERLLSLLVADPSAHEVALDLADSIRRRFEKSASALWAEAVIREHRGERARAAERYLSLSNQSRKDGDSLAALCAAEAAARVAREQAPQLAVSALHQILGLKPDHLPSLQELARSSDFAGDRAGAIRAYRRIAALTRDPAESAQAHIELARLCAQSEDDEAAARLHCEAALRLSPDRPEALQQLAELCFKSGEHLRAIKAADRLHQVAMARHQLERVAEASLLAGRVWEVGLKQYENALLRYREAASLRPTHAPSAFCRGRVAEKVGRLQEALASYQQAIELADPAPSTEEIRHAAHQSHHALARLARTRLGDPARAWQHLRAALALEPRDQAALDELLPYLRVSGHADELADACEKAAAMASDSQLRAALLAESGEMHRARLGNIERARRILATALEADPLNRSALESMLALAESLRDGMELCRCLRSLAELTTDPGSRLRYYRRLAVAARDLTGDADLAAFALAEVLKLEPEDQPALAELCTLQRQRGDLDGLASSLEKRARAAERQGDEKLSSTVLRELAQILDVKLGRSAEAFFALEKAARLTAEPEVLFDFADLALRCERFEQGRRALETVIASGPPPVLSERLAETYSKLGLACERTGDTDASLANYARAFQLRPLDSELVARLEAIYSKRERFCELAELYASHARALEAIDAAESANHFFRAATAARETPEEMGFLCQALRLKPLLVPARIRRAEVLAETDPRSALEDFQAVLQATDVGPSAPQGEAAIDLMRAAALTAVRAGDAKAAEHYLARYASHRPGDLEAQQQLASVYRELGSRGELFAVLAKLWPRLEGEQRKETCREYVQLALELKDSLPLEGAERCDAFSQVAELCLDVGELPTAIAAFEEASRQGHVAKRTEALVRRAALLEQQGDWELAGQSYETALALAPRHPVATDGLKRALRATEDWAGLAEVLAAEAAQAPKECAAPLYQELGLLYLHRLNQKRPAEAALRAAARLDKSNLLVRRELLNLLAERGELAAAAELVEEGAEVASAEAGAALLRAGVRVAEAAGDLQLALRLARRAHQLSPAEGEFLLQLAHLLYVQGGWREALPLYRELAAQIDPEDLPDVAREVLLRLADLAEQCGVPDLAEQTLTRLLRQDPLCAPAADRLSSLLWPTRPREAVEVLWSHARQLGPSQQRVDRLVALASRVRGDLADVDLASQLLREAAEKAPDPISAHRCLSELYRAAGRIPELLDALATVRALSQQRGDVAGMLDTAEEEVQLLLQTGRVDEALASLQRMSELAADPNSAERAAGYQLRRADLSRDLKCDLEAAQQCLQASFQLSKQLLTAEAGVALAQRRHDAAAEAQWLLRSVELHSQTAQRVQTLLRLSVLFLGPLRAPDRAEAALREALELNPERQEAEDELVSMLQNQERYQEIAAYFERAAERSNGQARRAQLLRKAADFYHRLGRPDAAAIALLGLPSFEAQDLALMAEAAEQLQQAGKSSEVAQLDSVLLAADPLRSPNFERHHAFLKDCDDHQALAPLQLRRAQALTGLAAARSYLDAALSYRALNQEAQARDCERQAFTQAPEDDQAFAAARSQAQSDPRQLAEVLRRRAQSNPEEATPLLRQRAHLLAREEPLLAAQALDDLLQVAPDDAEALRERGDLAARAGGPSAAQPFDRRLLTVARDELSPELLSKIHFRLGRASFASGAFRDAADSLEEVTRLDVSGDQSREALSLLSESFAQLADMAGLLRVTLQLAGRTSGEEAEALYRRAADMAPEPAQALDALLPLARLHPSDPSFVERAARGLRDLDRYPELAELYERSAEASGGIVAAERLLAAAEIANQRLQDPARAAADLERAAHLYLQLSQPAKALDCWLEAGAGEPKKQTASGLSELLLEKSRELGGEVHARVLEHLAPMEDDPPAQAKLYTELGEACVQLATIPKAREAFQRALAADPQSLPAAKRLFELAPTSYQANLFVALAEQMLLRLGGEALEGHREALGEAYDLLGRKGDAYLCLSRLPETAPRLRKRMGLARELGLYGEALQMQERLSEDPAELEKVLLGYLQAHLLPFAVRLAERLLQAQTLSVQTRRWMAQRFAPSSEGAALAARLWPDLLKANVLDADGWTLFAEALRNAGRSADARIADGFGAALSGGGAPTSLVPVRPVARSPAAEWTAERLRELATITSDSMPRLYSAIAPQLQALGAGDVQLYLSVRGGAEAFLVQYDELVIGAGALACFGTPELTYLIALALALGERGWQLQHSGPVEGLESAAHAAFDAVPGSLAACRVLAQLDERVRGSDPGSIQRSDLLKTGRLFASLASRALERI